MSVQSCAAKSELQQKFGADCDYYLGLRLLSEKKEKDAVQKFILCSKKGSYYVAERSAEILCSLGTMQEKNSYSQKLLDSYYGNPDFSGEVLYIALSQFEKSHESKLILENSQNLNLQEDDNRTIKIRMQALSEKKIASLEDEVFEWFTSRPLSAEHYQFYRDVYFHPDFNSLENFVYSPKDFALNYRIELYKRNYTYTASKAGELFEYIKNGDLPMKTQFISDVGKSFLYGSVDYTANANSFAQFAQEYQGDAAEYYFWFYAGRLFSKNSLYYNQSRKCFENAFACAEDSLQKDNALWYLFSESLSYSVDSILEGISLYSGQWTDASYFDDFFESFVSSLIAAGRWNDFYRIYTHLDGKASDEIVAEYAYIYARLLEENLATPPQGVSKNQATENALRRALNSGSSYYYKSLAAYKLSLAGSELEDVLLKSYSDVHTEKSEEAEKLMEGYVAFGFPEKIFPEYQRIISLNQNILESDILFYLSDFLKKCAQADESYYQQSLRIASKAANLKTEKFSKEELELVYPKDFFDDIEANSKLYEITPSIMYALVRSESFFDPKVRSSAGAVGLCQLMEFTAGDIATSLKVQDYNLTDSALNIKFGTYYLSSLIRRCDNSILQGFFSYNAGITRVRRWLQTTTQEFGRKSNMPQDLFLETLPYTETREYGRKLVAATAMYEWLYADGANSATAETGTAAGEYANADAGTGSTADVNSAAGDSNADSSSDARFLQIIENLIY